MSKIVACAICGVVRGPDTIEGCFANARAAGLEGHLIDIRLTKPLAGGDDFAHIWVEQPEPSPVYGVGDA